jgi:hypothetical protein
MTRHALSITAIGVLAGLASPAAPAAGAGSGIDLAGAAIVISPRAQSATTTLPATLLADEVERRSGIRLPLERGRPARDCAVIAIGTRDQPAWEASGGGEPADPAAARAEGFSIRTTRSGRAPATIVITGADGRGAMYGAGWLLRALRLGAGRITLDGELNLSTAPACAIRGHQLGYRARANSYDAWTPAQFEQYIREQILFGANCVESIPLQDIQPGPLMPVSRAVMNRSFGEICAKYDIDHWAWMPADFPLEDENQRKAALEQHETFYRECPRLDAVFFPGGDPGDNPPELVIPFLKSLGTLLARYHPRAKIWVSLQGFSEAKASRFMAFLEQEEPSWLGGLVAGPSSPPLDESRRRLPKRYGLRWYPDITHTVRCQFPVHGWDPAFAFTLGREPPNPRPTDYAAIFRACAPFTDGVLTYSDGIHDDLNKAVLSMLAWDPRRNPRDMLVDYARLFFGAEMAEAGADALLGLEQNWRGSLAENGGVDGVLSAWEGMQRKQPALGTNWRFQMHLMRACYDAYTRNRLINETRLEEQAMTALARAREVGPGRAMDEALAILARADAEPGRPPGRERIRQLADALFKSIGYQTSVRLYQASGAERGCILDFLDHPLNNRWWLEDEFARIRRLPSRDGQCGALEVVRTWDHPGEGSFYDDVGHVGRSPHVVHEAAAGPDPEARFDDDVTHSWWDSGLSRRRLSWQHHMRWPPAVVYEGLDTGATYQVRITGHGDSLVRANGKRLEPARYSKEIGGFKEFPVPRELTAGGRLRLTWDDIDESQLNWRQQSHVAEVWLLKR